MHPPAVCTLHVVFPNKYKLRLSDKKENAVINIFLLADVEGLAGVDSMAQMDRKSPEYENTRILLCDSINKAVSACFEAKADKVYYLDGHGGGGNAIENLIDPRAKKCTIQSLRPLLITNQYHRTRLVNL